MSLKNLNMRKLNNNDKKSFLKFILKKPVQNTYIIGNYFKYGLNSADVIFYANSYKSGDLKFILMNYYNDFVFFTTENLNDEFLAKIKQIIIKKNFRIISGDNFSITQIHKIFENAVLRKTKMMTLTRFDNLKIDDVQSRKLKISDLHQASNLLKSIDEFKPKFDCAGLTRVKRMISEDETYGYFLKEKLVALLSVTAKSPHGCMLTDICTDKQHRGKGFAKELIIFVSCQLFQEGINNINLYVDNSKAIKLYENIGFKKCGEYNTLKNI